MKEPKKLVFLKKNTTFYIREYNANCDEIIFITSYCRALRNKIVNIKKNFRSQAVRLRHSSNDSVTGFAILSSTVNPYLLSVTNTGRYKLSHIEEYRITKLGGKGVRNFASNYGTVVFCEAVKMGDELKITINGKVKTRILDESDIKGRGSKGRKFHKKVNLVKGDINIVHKL